MAVPATWIADINGVRCTVVAWTRAEARDKLKERFAMKTLPRKATLKKLKS